MQTLTGDEDGNLPEEDQTVVVYRLGEEGFAAFLVSTTGLRRRGSSGTTNTYLFSRHSEFGRFWYPRRDLDREESRGSRAAERVSGGGWRRRWWRGREGGVFVNREE